MATLVISISWGARGPVSWRLAAVRRECVFVIGPSATDTYSNLILRVFRRIENGLPCRVYLDNGSDFRKAFGKRLRKQGKTEWDGPTEERMQARFAPVGAEVVCALPYNAQAKAIERMFRTFRHRFDEDFAAYRGALGKKSEFAGELYYRPSELPTISELALSLQLAIRECNATPHTGRGMSA